MLRLFPDEFARIRQRVQEDLPGRFLVENDLFQKDLGISRQILFPVGNSPYEESGLPRGLIFLGGIAQFMRFGWYLLFSAKGMRPNPYYEGHIHLDAVNTDFSESSREEVGYGVAEMLRVNKHVKGMIATAWIYDPALEKDLTKNDGCK